MLSEVSSFYLAWNSLHCRGKKNTSMFAASSKCLQGSWLPRTREPLRLRGWERRLASRNYSSIPDTWLQKRHPTVPTSAARERTIWMLSTNSAKVHPKIQRVDHNWSLRERCKVKLQWPIFSFTPPSPADQPWRTAVRGRHGLSPSQCPVTVLYNYEDSWDARPHFRKNTEEWGQTWWHPRVRGRFGQGVHLLPVEVIVISLTISTCAVWLIKEAAAYKGRQRGDISYNQRYEMK